MKNMYNSELMNNQKILFDNNKGNLFRDYYFAGQRLSMKVCRDSTLNMRILK